MSVNSFRVFLNINTAKCSYSHKSYGIKDFGLHDNNPAQFYVGVKFTIESKISGDTE